MPAPYSSSVSLDHPGVLPVALCVLVCSLLLLSVSLGHPYQLKSYKYKGDKYLEYIKNCYSSTTKRQLILGMIEKLE